MRKTLAIFSFFLVSILSVIPLSFADDITVTASVSSYLTVTFNYNTVDFGTVTAGQTINTTELNLTEKLNVTVDTNDDFQVLARATDWSGAKTYTLTDFPIYFDTGLTVGDAGKGKLALTTSDTTVDSYLYTNTGTHYHFYEIVVPSNVKAGSYSNTVTITYQTA